MQLTKYLLFLLILNSHFALASNPSWVYKANFGGTERFDAYGFANGDKGYVGGGVGIPSSANYNDFWEYNAISNVWTQKASNPTLNTIQDATSFSIGSKGYVVGGTTPSSIIEFDAMWIYDIPSNTWTSGPVFPGGTRKSLTSFVIGNDAYVGLGLEFDISTFTSVPQSDFYRYNAVNNTWFPSAGITGGARSFANGFAVNGFGYVVGGATSTAVLNELKQYNPTTNSWSAKAPHPGFITGGVTATCGGEGYLIGAFAPFQGHLVYKYSPVSNSWSPAPDLLSARGRAVGFSIQDTIYITTGLAFVGPGSQPSFTTQALNPGAFVGINEITSISGIIYPSITNGRLFISKEFLNTMSSMENSLNIYSISGQLIKSVKLNSEIDISDLDNGVYNLILPTGKYCKVFLIK